MVRATALRDGMPRLKLILQHSVSGDGYNAQPLLSAKVDVVVFSAPQLSLFELRELANLCEGRSFTVPLLAVTSPQVKPDSDRMGYTARIEDAGGTVLSGMCFYQSYAREIAEAKGWKSLATNSAKLVNILGGYGYQPMIGSMEACVDAAVSGRLASQ